MGDVNWWLMALAFVLGVVLTFVLTIRRVTREVPVYAALGRGPHTVDDSAGAVTEEPYGAGSVRVAATADGPSGFTVKGNEDSMLYHTAESPSYKQTIAEIWFRDVDSAERAGFTRWDSAGAVTPAVTEEPYGAGSARVAAGGTAPSGFTVKGNEESMLYHSTESPSYGVTRAEVWFRDVETAEKAGFSRWDSGKSQRGLK